MKFTNASLQFIDFRDTLTQSIYHFNDNHCVFDPVLT